MTREYGGVGDRSDRRQDLAAYVEDVELQRAYLAGWRAAFRRVLRSASLSPPWPPCRRSDLPDRPQSELTNARHSIDLFLNPR